MFQKHSDAVVLYAVVERATDDRIPDSVSYVRSLVF